MDSINISMGRTVQLIDFKDSVKYHVSIGFTRDIEGGEAIPPFVTRAQRETAEIFKQVEEAMLDSAEAAAHEQVEANSSFGSVNEMERLDPQFSAPKGKTRRPPPRK